MDHQSNGHTWQREGTPQRPAHPSFEKDVSPGGVLTSKHPTKRLFSETLQRQAEASDDETDIFEDAENGYEPQREDGPSNSARKRQRSQEWPLSATREPLLPRANAPNSPPIYPRRSSSIQTRRPAPHKRASSFIEGTMNDRASVPPPANFLENEDNMERYDDERNQAAKDFMRTNSGGFVNRAEESLPSTNPAEAPKRFGKNMVSVFNPRNWSIFKKSSKASKSEKAYTVAHDFAASEQAYRELKESQAFKAHTTQSSRFPRPQKKTRNSVDKSPQRSTVGAEEPSHGSVFELPSRQSSIDRARPETPKAEKRYGRMYDVSPLLRQHDSRAPSPSSVSQSSLALNDELSVKRTSSFSFKKPNFTHHSRSGSAEIRPRSSENIPSKKQLLQEQKLVKKISNLEFKLEEARRQLAESQSEIGPVTTMERLDKVLNERPAVEFDAEPSKAGRRQRFVPGALATLPSERLLSAHVEPEEVDEYDSDDAFTQGLRQLQPQSKDSSSIDEFVPQSHSQSLRRVESQATAITAAKKVTREVKQIPRSNAPQVRKHMSEAPEKFDYQSDCKRDNESTSSHMATNVFEVATFPANHEESATSLSSLHSSQTTGDTVIHRHLSSGSTKSQPMVSIDNQLAMGSINVNNTEDLDVGLAKASGNELHADQDIPEIEPAQRKVSNKRKSFKEKMDEAYKPSKSSDSDDVDADATPRKSVSRLNVKKQKTSAAETPKNRAQKRSSLDSPKGSFVSSTQYPKRASVTPSPKTSMDSPRDSYQRSPIPAKQASSPKDALRKGMNMFPPPPSSPFSFTAGRPGTPAAGKKHLKTILKGSNSPSIARASSPKKSVAAGSMSGKIYDSQEEDFIPPVPQIPQEVLKKHRESAKLKPKKLTMEDVQRHKKATSVSDIPRPSIENEEVTVESTKSLGIPKVEKKIKEEKNEKENEYQWDDDVF